MPVTITDTYVHLDGTPARGSVSIRPTVMFHDGTRTVVGSWQTRSLDASGRVAFTVDWPVSTQPAPVGLQVLESVSSCQGSRYWTVGAELLVDGATVVLGQVRPTVDVPADAPRYVPVPGPAGPGGLSIDDLIHAAPVPYDDAQGYSAGAAVLYGAEYWLAKRDTQAGQSPTANPGAWLILNLDDTAVKAAHAANQATGIIDAAAAATSWTDFQTRLGQL